MPMWIQNDEDSCGSGFYNAAGVETVETGDLSGIPGTVGVVMNKTGGRRKMFITRAK